MYSAASAVLVNECLKGSISLSIALYNTLRSGANTSAGAGYAPLRDDEKDGSDDKYGGVMGQQPSWSMMLSGPNITRAAGKLRSELLR